MSGVLMPSPSAQPFAVNARYTLTRALRWLGHSCPGCPTVTEDILHAPVWFIRRGGTRPMVANLVVVDLAGSSLCSKDRRQLLQAVNDCTQQDRIRVRERSDADGDRASATAELEDGPHAGPDYRVFGGVSKP